MAKQRRLENLFVTGETVPLDDHRGDVVVETVESNGKTTRRVVATNVTEDQAEGGTFEPYGPVIVWVQPINVPEQELAARKASAKRATVLMFRHDPTSEGYLEVREKVEEYDDDFVLVRLATEDLWERREAIGAELAAEEEWSKDDYLQGLRDAWESPADGEEGLKDVYAKNPEDPVARQAFSEFKRFAAEVEERFAPIYEDAKLVLAMEGQANLRDRLTKLLIQEAANSAWSEEYRRCEIWLGTREPCATCLLEDPKSAPHGDHSKRYFASREAVDSLSDEIFLLLRGVHAALSVDVVTGKGSPVTPSSSPSSGPSTEAEPDQSSGLAVASA